MPKSNLLTSALSVYENSQRLLTIWDGFNIIGINALIQVCGSASIRIVLITRIHSSREDRMRTWTLDNLLNQTNHEG